MLNSKCYLHKSGVLPEKELEVDTIEVYSELLKELDIPEWLYHVITEFLVPFKISFVKFNLNREYYEQPFPVDFTHNHSYIAPSLRTLKKPTNRPLGYPNWFFWAFPDVVVWGSGNKLLEKHFGHLSKDQLVYNDTFRPEILYKLIKLYQKKTGKELECKLYPV
jgi:hypothetical protein